MLTVRYRRPVAGDPQPPTQPRRSNAPSAATSKRLPIFAYLATALVIYGVAWFCTKGILLPLFFAIAFLLPTLYFSRKLANITPEKPTPLEPETEPDRIEVLQVEAKRVFDIDVPAALAPALCFELSDGQYMLLCGPWLMEHRLYRAPESSQRGNSTRFNGLDDPYGFPATRFSLHRWKGDAQPFWIEVQGWYLLPEMGAAQLRSGIRVRPVEIFAAASKDLQTSIDKALSNPG